MRNRIYNSILAISLYLLITGFGEPKNSTLEVNVTKNKEETLTLLFKVAPKENMSITVDAPWELTMTDTEGLSLKTDKNIFTTKAFDPKIPGFRVESGKINTSKASGVVSYKLKSFICTKDKSQCFQEIHKGNINWNSRDR
ncbi:MAG: hypothetical protein HQK54_06795 [Oligoflexales bacterium]|nr:hypothetical protein [Oligoflexales bacterium]